MYKRQDYDYPVYAYFSDGYQSSFYVLPKTLTGLELHYYDYSGFSLTQAIDLDPDIELSVGDAVTFTIDLNAIFEGAGSGTFNWEEINWNDLGEVTVP